MNANKEENVDLHRLALDALKDAGKADPASPFYVRKHIRPKVNILRDCFLAMGYALIFSATLTGCLSASMPPVLCLVFAIVAFDLFAVLHLRVTVTEGIRLYQHFAPDSIRNKCRFEPSCSQYMLLAIDKYGIYRGLAKGIDRLKRCAPPNGGIDEP